MPIQVDLFGIIGEPSYWEDEDEQIISAQKVVNILNKAGGEDVTLRVFSKGGDFFEGAAIHAALASYEGFVKCRVMGLAASAAAFAIMGCDEIEMEAASQLMIHNARSGVYGDMNTMREKAKQLEDLQVGMVEAFVNRTGQDKDKIQELLDAETWMGAERAVELGFADGVYRAEKTEQVAASITKRDMKLFGYQSVPDTVAATAGDQGQLFQTNNTNQTGDITMNDELINELGLSVDANASNEAKKKAIMDGVKALKTRTQKLDQELSEAKAKAEKLDTVKAELESTRKQVREQEIQSLVRATLDESGVVLSDEHQKELRARAEMAVDADKDEVKDRIAADMKNYASVNGVEAGSNGLSGGAERSKVTDGKQSFEDKLDARAQELMKADKELDYVDAMEKAFDELSEDETAKQTVYK